MGVADVARNALRQVVRRLQTVGVERRIAVVQPMPPNVPDGVILFFTPEAGVRPHLAAQCVVARTMQEQGHRVLFVRCFELFSRCPVMDMYNAPYDMTPAQMHQICLRCGGASLRMLGAYGFDVLDLRLVATPELRERARDAVRDAPQDLRDFTYDGIPFGRISVMDIVLVTKVSEFDVIDDATRLAWLQYIESGVLAYLIVNRLLDERTVSRMVHFEDYTVLLGARLAAARRGIPSVTVSQAGHKNIDRQRYILASYAGASLDMASVRVWPAWRELALSEAQVHDVADDLITRLRGVGSHLFSPPKTFHHRDIRDDLRLAKDRKLVVAYTSSLDEKIAEEMRLASHGLAQRTHRETFADQMAWLDALVAFAEQSDDIQLVVRVHPREGAGSRACTSQHLARLRERFDRGYHACRFIWPNDPVSSFDLAEAADLVLISWSSIGVELARLGVPVLASTVGIGAYPHDDFIEFRDDRNAWFAQLRAQIGLPARLDTVAHAFRWYQLAQLGVALDLSDVVPTTSYSRLPPFKVPREAEAIEQAVLGNADVLSLNLQRQLAAQGTTSAANERRALQRELRRLVHFICTGRDVSADIPLHLNPSRPNASGGAVRTMRVDGNTIHYASDGRTWIKYSPLCARLALLCAS